MRIRFSFVLIAVVISLALVMPAAAQTKLKFAHVYETGEAFHKEALWAAGEIGRASCRERV